MKTKRNKIVVTPIHLPQGCKTETKEESEKKFGFFFFFIYLLFLGKFGKWHLQEKEKKPKNKKNNIFLKPCFDLRMNRNCGNDKCSDKCLEKFNVLILEKI